MTASDLDVTMRSFQVTDVFIALSGENTQSVHRLCFNSRYFQDFLQVAAKAESPTFLLGFKDSISPFELYLPHEREGFRYILMPLRGD
jgi:DNA polymerase III sliding clamp (beta) subunit (PCNA family)